MAHHTSSKDSTIEKAEIEAIELSSAVHASVSYKPADEHQRKLDRKINLKLDLFVTFLLGLAFLFCGIDKTNIGNAATSTFVKDAHLGPADVGNAVSLFAVTFVPLQPFSVSLGRYIGAKVSE